MGCVHHDYARPHASLMTHQWQKQFNWDLSPLLPYPPDLAPSYLRLSQRYLNGVHFNSEEKSKIVCSILSDGDDDDLCRRGLME